ncbi:MULTISPECIES: SDR family NAD(P)-dependent oxidoreductase [unclassified Lentimicrobium]|uniref:SDR family NAD(P)-dependent oxidoreductase n=1 Tax=unclassified Lentimicrobium TaxID=2677434 RepID=UPI0015532132|nr:MULTISPECIES: SDR family NAD(P)-dependent oxidoreductase [unclassified Lentimicrobium]NPD46131.1 SDR family NAD(P)-dependent oxidoreductase [Lentimicrobium sp. S6]NPD86481.1 SDR family NAD(P)-dependent oxidoreductase [Lentimicrobium sp. L6]
MDYKTIKENIMKNKTCFITGANSGIGKQAAIQLARAGLHIIMGARNKQRGESALSEVIEKSGSGNVELLEIDMSSRKSIFSASELLHRKIESLDVLIHNAADFDISHKQPKKSEDGVETIWATNHIGPILLTNSVMDLIKNSLQGRIITIASQGLVIHSKLTIDIQDPEFKSRKFSVTKAYYQSKLAQVVYTYWLAEQLKDTAITVNCIRVTNVKVDTSRYPNISGFMKFLYSIKSRFSISPEDMAKTYAYLATSTDLIKTTGKYFNEKNNMVNSSPYSLGKQNIDAVLNLSMSYCD